jgi:hypothetical protein
MAGLVMHVSQAGGPVIRESFLQEVESKIIKTQLIEKNLYVSFIIVSFLSELLVALLINSRNNNLEGNKIITQGVRKQPD